MCKSERKSDREKRGRASRGSVWLDGFALDPVMEKDTAMLALARVPRCGMASGHYRPCLTLRVAVMP